MQRFGGRRSDFPSPAVPILIHCEQLLWATTMTALPLLCPGLYKLPPPLLRLFHPLSPGDHPCTANQVRPFLHMLPRM